MAENEQEQLPRDSLKKLELYRGEIHFENQMLSSSLGAYLSCQSFLMIAFGSSVAVGWSEPGIFTLLIPFPMTVLGIVLSVAAWLSIRASSSVIDQWHGRQNELLENYLDLEPYWPTQHEENESPRDPTLSRRFYEGSRFTQQSPWIFGAMWIYLLFVTLWLYTSGSAEA